MTASTLLSLLLAIGLYHVTFHVAWLRYVAFLVSATLGAMGMGTAIALFVRQASSASNIANILAMSMMFLAGIYFPVEIMPPFFRGLSRALPLTYMAEGMRYVTGVIDLTPAYFWAITCSCQCRRVGRPVLPALFSQT